MSNESEGGGDPAKEEKASDEAKLDSKDGEDLAKEEKAPDKAKEEGKDGDDPANDNSADEAEEEDGEQDKWKTAQPYGHDWQKGDVICCAASLPGGQICFGLNGDFSPPMGDAFDLQLPQGAQLCLVVAAGVDGRLKVNVGQTSFQSPPPSTKHRGLGEAMRIRPTWQVSLPKEVKAWPVYTSPSRSSEGRKPLKNGDIVEQVVGHAAIVEEEEPGWLRHEKGWSLTCAAIAGKEYEAIKNIPPWKGIDTPEAAKKKKRSMQRVVHATFDVEQGSKNNWTFKGTDSAKNTSGPTMLLSAESAATGILRWCIKINEGCTNFQVGVIPASQSQEPSFLNDSGECGVKNKDAPGGDNLSERPMYNQYVEVIADMGERKARFLMGEERAHLAEMEKLDIPYEEDVRLAITGNEDFDCTLELPLQDNLDDDSEGSDGDVEYGGPSITTCGNAVQGSTWHVVTLTADLPNGEFRVTLDGEPHLDVRDPMGLLTDGPLAIDPDVGLFLFGSTRRGAGGGFLGGDADWRAGGHLRSLRLDSKALRQFDVWSLHLPKGIWRSRAGSWNPADSRMCWRSRETRPKSGMRPPGDADPRHEGLTIVTGESFRELVLESKKHVFVVASAAWCGACQALKPRWEQLAQALAAENSVTIATVDMEENELPSRYFPETYIPIVKLFILGKKRNPVPFKGGGSASFKQLAEFLQEHTGVCVRTAIELAYPAYCERMGIETFLRELRSAAMRRPLQRAAGQNGMKVLAAFLHEYLLDPSHEPGVLTNMRPLPGPPVLGRRAISEEPASSAGVLQQPIPLQRMHSSDARAVEGSQTAGPPLVLRRTVSEAVPQRRGSGLPSSRGTRKRGPVEGLKSMAMAPMETIDEGLVQRLCTELVDKLLTAALRSAQPDDPREFTKVLFMQVSEPLYEHQSFFNGRTRKLWVVPPPAVKLLAATRILRAMLRFIRRRGIHLAQPSWASQQVAEMSAAALRHNWRRMETAIVADDQVHTLSDIKTLLERGFQVNSAPFGASPLLLAAAVGNLPAAQYLYVHGANPHLPAGRPKVLPIEAAAFHGHLSLVEFLAENGSVTARALHFAAASGSLDVARFLLVRGASTELRIGGLSSVAIAIMAQQQRLAARLLPEARASTLHVPLTEDGCRSVGLPDGSTLLHVASAVGGLLEPVVVQMAHDSNLVKVENKGKEAAFDLMSNTLKAAFRPQHYLCFTKLGLVPSSSPSTAWIAALKEALSEGGDASAINLGGFGLLDLACLTSKSELVSELLAVQAPVAARGLMQPSALMWAHWMKCEDAVLALCGSGASLSNADLEGLQHLRLAQKELEGFAEAEGDERADKKGKSSASEKKQSSTSERRTSQTQLKVGSAKEDASLKISATANAEGKCGQASASALMDPNLADAWFAGIPCRGYMPAARRGLALRMAWGVGACLEAASPPQEEHERPSPSEFLETVSKCADGRQLSLAKLLALRHIAEGSGVACADIVALHLFATDVGFHHAICQGATVLATQQPDQEEIERAMDVQPAMLQVANAMKALPAQKVVCFRACRFSASSLKELLRGHRHALDGYRPGSIVTWRHAASATTDPTLAEELALRGEPTAGCGVVFKVRRSVGARPISTFSDYPEHGEVAFPPGTCFRVVGLCPFSERLLRRGAQTSQGLSRWDVDVGYPVQRTENLNWEDACRSRICIIILNEEDPTALQSEGLI